MKQEKSPSKRHSAKVPQSYKVSAKICKAVKEDGGSLKNLLYECKNKYLPIKSVYAMVVKTLHNGTELDRILKETDLFKKEPHLDPWLARVLITQLLSGRQLAATCRPVETILKYSDVLKNALGNGNSLSSETEAIKLVYARVNTLKSSVESEITTFMNEGWELQPKSNDYKTYLKKVKNELLTIREFVFLQDFHVPELLVFPPKSSIYSFDSVEKGRILLQDKASCLDILLLRPQPGSVVLDMCAAPGMKASYIAAVMKNQGTLYAVERDEKRYKTLLETLKLANVTCAKPILNDVTKVDAEQCPGVEYILLDPTCSGSGMIDRKHCEDTKEEISKERLRKLGGLQISLLRHALTAFPSAKRVVYSTCSINKEENEEVIQAVLKQTHDSFKLIDAKSLLKGWFNSAATTEFEFGSKCIYAKTDIDYTNGFFIAVFERNTENVNSNTSAKTKQKSVKKNKKTKHISAGNGTIPVSSTDNTTENNELTNENDTEWVTKKKKRKKERKENKTEETEEEKVDTESMNKLKKRKSENLEDLSVNSDEEKPKHKKKKKKKKNPEGETFD